MNRYKVVDGSQSNHCCFDYTIVDTTKPTGYNDTYEEVCECFYWEDALFVCSSLNHLDDHLTELKA